MVIAPANTGKESNSKTAVMNTDQGKRGTLSKPAPNGRKFPRVLIKFTAPNKEETPAKWREKIAKSTEAPECAIFLLNGGYTVHPVPAPLSTSPLKSKRVRAGNKNQNLILLSRGKAMSGAPIIKGTSQFPNPPIRIGITIKKIITKAWAVTTTL